MTSNDTLILSQLAQIDRTHLEDRRRFFERFRQYLSPQAVRVAEKLCAGQKLIYNRVSGSDDRDKVQTVSTSGYAVATP